LHHSDLLSRSHSIFPNSQQAKPPISTIFMSPAFLQQFTVIKFLVFFFTPPTNGPTGQLATIVHPAASSIQCRNPIAATILGCQQIAVSIIALLLHYPMIFNLSKKRF